MTRDPWESAGREAAPSWSGLESSGGDRGAVTAQRERDLHGDLEGKKGPAGVAGTGTGGAQELGALLHK